MNSSSNSQQTMWVAIGQFLAYAIGIVTPMILSRYFDKGDYGTYKQVMYVYHTLITVFTFGLPRAYSYFIPRVSLAESKDVVRKITNVFVVIGVSISLVLFLGSSIIADLLKNPDLKLALMYFSPTPLFLLPVMGLDCIMASYKKTQFVAIYSFFTKIFTIVFIVLPVIVFDGNYLHAIIGFDIASFLNFVLAFYIRNIPTKGISLEKTTVTIKEIMSFTVPLIVASVWIMIFQSVNQFFVSRYYGNEVFADFSNGFIEFPVIPMVVSSVATVLMPLFSDKLVHDVEGVKTTWINALGKSVKITYPIAVFSIVFASLIMSCFYGDNYESSGIYFLIKNFEGLFMIIPFYPIILALGKTKQYSNIHLVMAIAIIPLEYLVVKFGLPAWMIGVVFEVCVFAKMVLQFNVVSKAIDMTFSDLIPIKSMAQITGLSLLSSVLPYLLYHFLVDQLNKFVLLFVVGILFLVIYYILCWVLHITYKEVIKGFISNNWLNKLLKFVP